MPMTIDEIKDDADMAETWPGSRVLNWNEIGFKTLAAWVTLSVEIGGDATLPDCDVESVKGCFERWWRDENNEAVGRGPAAGPRTHEPMVGGAS